MMALNNDIPLLIKIYLMDSSPPHKEQMRNRNMSPSTIKKRSLPPYDRHIMRFDRTKFEVASSTSSDKSASSYQSSLEETLLKKKSFKQFTMELSKRRSKSVQRGSVQWRPTQPLRAFRVQGWKDNYYTSLLDWSYNNFICAASNSDLYFYNMAIDDELESSLYRRYRLPNSRGETVNSVRFSPRNTRIALGYSQGSLKSYDYVREKFVVSRKCHRERVGALEWWGGVVYSGSKDLQLLATDTKTGKDCLAFGRFHQQEICGVRSNGRLLATGGNDNCVAIYDLRRTEKPLASYQHDAAVKALDWTPNDALVSGGGTSDRRLKFWRDGEGVFSEIDTGSQVCGLRVSPNSGEIVSCQGFSLNQIIVWGKEGGRELTIHGHSERVLYCALSPSGELLASGAGDQQLKIWKVFRRGSRGEWLEGQLR